MVEINEVIKRITPIIKRSVELINSGNQDEIVGVVVRLTKQIQKTENIEDMMELSLLSLIDEIKDNKDV